MSVRVISRVFEDSRAELGARIVLIVLADSAHDDGITWISQPEVARKARLSESQVRRVQRTLVELGELEVRKLRRGRSTINVYRVLLAPADPDLDRLPGDVAGLFSPAQDERLNEGFTRANLTDSPAQIRPVPPLIETLNRKENRKGPQVVDRARVTDAERDLAETVLASWNEQAGSRLSASAWLGKIVMRCREHPELDADAHAEIIRYALAHPWWSGGPSPSVVYGSAEQFERSLVAATSNGPRAPTAEDFGDLDEL